MSCDTIWPFRSHVDSALTHRKDDLCSVKYGISIHKRNYYLGNYRAAGVRQDTYLFSILMERDVTYAMLFNFYEYMF